MNHRGRSLARILLCDLSLTSSRNLGRLFSHSEAPFWTACNQSQSKLLHSDYPLYFASFDSPRLNLNKPAEQDRYCLFLQSALIVTSQSLLDGRFQHSPFQPLARHSFFLFLHSRFLTKIVEICSCAAYTGCPLSWMLWFCSKLLPLHESVSSPLFLGLFGFLMDRSCCLACGFSSELVAQCSNHVPAIPQWFSASTRPLPAQQARNSATQFLTKGVDPCRTVEDVYVSNHCSQPRSLACPSTPISRTW
jgi:hypothetical protein